MSTEIINYVVLFAGSFCLFNWVALLVRAIGSFSALPVLARLPGRGNESEGPRLSIIVAACDEAENLRISVPLLLAQTYRPIELILINDRSTDETGSTIDFFAATDSRVKPVHIDQLTPGWLGKVHALQRGVELATGDYLLFTDADIEFAPQVLSSAVAYAESEGVDHLVVLPFNRGRCTFLTGLINAAFGMLYFDLTRARPVNHPEDRSLVGIGAFNLVKRSAFEKTPGFTWLRMEVVDDIGLGLMLKQAGYSAHVLNGFGSVELDWYPSLWATILGLEKSLFAALGHYRYGQALLRALGLTATAVGPFAAFLYTESWLLGAAVLLFQFVVPGMLGLMSRRETRDHAMISFLLPIGYLLLVFALLRSAYCHWSKGGIRWRGTHYSSMELREGVRVRL